MRKKSEKKKTRGEKLWSEYSFNFIIFPSKIDFILETGLIQSQFFIYALLVLLYKILVKKKKNLCHRDVIQKYYSGKLKKKAYTHWHIFAFIWQPENIV